MAPPVKYIVMQDELEECLTKNMKYKEMAEHFNCKIDTIYRKLKQYRLKEFRKEEIVIKKEELKKVFNECGKSITITADSFGTYFMKIKNLLIEYNIEIPTDKDTRAKYNNPAKRENDISQNVIEFDLKIGDKIKTINGKCEVIKLYQETFLTKQIGHRYNAIEMFNKVDYTHLREVRKVV